MNVENEYEECEVMPWTEDMRLFRVQLQDRATGKLLGRAELFLDATEACARADVLQFESDMSTTDVCCWAE